MCIYLCMETYEEAKERLHEIVESALIKRQLKEAFHNLIDTQFVEHYNITKKSLIQLQNNYRLESAKCKLYASKIDTIHDFDKIKSQIDNSFFNLLETTEIKPDKIDNLIDRINISIREINIIKQFNFFKFWK